MAAAAAAMIGTTFPVKLTSLFYAVRGVAGQIGVTALSLLNNTAADKRVPRSRACGTRTESTATAMRLDWN